MESGAKQGEENIGFKRPEHEIEEMVKRFPETASRGDCLDFVHVLDLVFLFLCKQAEFFNLHCMMRIKSDFFFHNILQPAYADWMKNHPDFFGNHPWEKLPNGQNPAIFYGEQMPAFLEKETLSLFFFSQQADEDQVRGNWIRYLEKKIRPVTIPLFASTANKDKIEPVLELGMAIWRKICSFENRTDVFV